LLQLAPENEEQHTYQQLGLALAECAIDNVPLAAPPAEQVVGRLPNVNALVAMNRAALLELSRAYRGSDVALATDEALALAHLSLSFARTDDLQAVAALLRLAAVAGVAEGLTVDAWSYVIDQQQPDGFFGMLSAELLLLERVEEAVTPRLAMTVEVLWALAAASSAPSENTLWAKSTETIGPVAEGSP
jgi:hypothetical protein